MKKIVIAALTAGFLLGLLLAPSASAATPAWSNNDRVFIRAVRAKAPAFKYIPAKDLISTAKLACKTLRQTGAEPYELAEIAVNSGMSQREAIALIAGAVVFYCPEFQ